MRTMTIKPKNISFALWSKISNHYIVDINGKGDDESYPSFEGMVGASDYVHDDDYGESVYAFYDHEVVCTFNDLIMNNIEDNSISEELFILSEMDRWIDSCLEWCTDYSYNLSNLFKSKENFIQIVTNHVPEEHRLNVLNKWKD